MSGNRKRDVRMGKSKWECGHVRNGNRSAFVGR